MSQSLAVLTQLSGGYEPLASGIPHQRRRGFEGVPGLSGRGPGGMAGMLAAPYMAGLMGQAGMRPLGAMHDQNVYDTLLNLRISQAQLSAMRSTAHLDREGYMRTLRGMAALTGTPFGGEQRRAAEALAGATAAAAPLMVELMPEFLDQLGGVRGSTTVFARRAIDAGRYRIDPVTGRLGMSAASVGALTEMVHRDLYSREHLPEMQGVSAGQLGSMMQQLQARGMIATAATAYGTSGRGDADMGGMRAEIMRAVRDLDRADPGRLRAAAQRANVDLGRGAMGLSGADLDKLTTDPAISDRLRSFDAGRVSRALRGTVGAIAAMRDILGDAGHPNAPLPELFRHLEAMTNGSMAQIGADRAGGMVRTTYNLARMTGVSLDNAMVLQQHAAARTQQLGIEPVFAVEAAQHGLAFGGAYRGQGHAAHSAWGLMNADQLQQLDTNLAAQARASPMANRVGAAMRIRDQLGGFQAGSAAHAYTQALQSGMNQWRDPGTGQLRSVNLTNEEFVRMAAGARTATGAAGGLSENDARQILNQTEDNREYVQRYQLGDVVRRAQGEELQGFVGGRLQETLATRLRNRLVSSGMNTTLATQQANTAATAISQRATQRYLNLSTEDFRNTRRRDEAMANILEEELTSSGQAGVLGTMTAPERAQFLQTTAGQFYGEANRAIRGSTYAAFGNLQNVQAATNEVVLNEGDRVRMQAGFQTQLQEAMAPLGRGSILQRAVDALQHVRPGDQQAMLRVISSSLGGVRQADIAQSLLRPMAEVESRRRRVEELRTEYDSATAPEARAQVRTQLEVAHRELRHQTEELVRLGEEHGLFSEGGVSAEDVQHARDSLLEVSRAQQDLTGLRGNFGAEVEPHQLSEGRARHGTRGTALEAQAVLVARRQRDLEILSRIAPPATDIVASTAHQAALATVSTSTRQELQRTMTNMRSETGLNDVQASRAAINHLRERVGYLPPAIVQAEAQSLSVTTDEEARALVRLNRRLVPARPSTEFVNALMREQPQLSELEARELATSRLRAQRLGIDHGMIQAIMREPTWQQVNEEVAGVAGMRDIAASHARRTIAGVAEDRGQLWQDREGARAYTPAEHARYQAAAVTARERLVTRGVGRSENAAIAEAMARRSARRYTVTDADITSLQNEIGTASLTPNARRQYLQSRGIPVDLGDVNQTVDDPAVQNYRETHPEAPNLDAEEVRRRVRQQRVEARVLTATRLAFRTARNIDATVSDSDVDAQTNREMLQHTILERRDRESFANFARFFNSSEGREFRERTDRQMQDMENTSQRLVATPHMTQRMGTRALEISTGIRDHAQRLRELALLNAGGDISRLMGGWLNAGLDPTEAAGVHREVAEIQAGYRAYVNELEDQQGVPGRVFRRGDERAARERVRQQLQARAQDMSLPEAERTAITAQVEALRAGDLPPEQWRSMRQRQRELGSMANAMAIRNLPPQMPEAELSEWQRGEIAGVRFGAGTEEEVSALYGRGRWQGMGATERARRLTTARAGVGTQAAAMTELGLTEITNDDDARRVAALSVGLATDAHARQLAGFTQTQALDTDMLRTVRGIRLGMTSDTVAREHMRLAPDRLSPETRAAVESDLLQHSNLEEALSLRGLPITATPLGTAESTRLRVLQAGGRAVSSAEARGAAPVATALSNAEARRAAGVATDVLTPAQRTALDATRVSQGGFTFARQTLGLSAATVEGTTEAEYQRVLAASAGTGTEAFARGLLNIEQDVALDPTRAHAVTRLRQGIGTYDSARAMLAAVNLVPAVGALQPQEVERVQQLQRGTGGDREAARAMLGFGADAGLSTNQLNLLRAATLGTNTEAYVAEQLGLDVAHLTPQQATLLRGARLGTSSIEFAQDIAGLSGRPFARLAAAEQQRVRLIQVGLGSEDAARLTQGLAANNLNARDQRLVDVFRTGLGSEAASRAQLRLVGDNLTVAERRRVDTTRVRLGGEEARRTVAGVALTGTLQGEALQRLTDVTQGYGSEAFAARTLGLTRQADGTYSTRDRERLTVAQAQYSSDAFIRQRLHIAADDRSAATLQRIGAARVGAGTEEHARLVEGVVANNLTPAVQQRNEAERRRQVSEEAVMAVMGVSRETLSPTQWADVQSLAADIGVARNLSADDQRFLSTHYQQRRTLEGMARGIGTDVESLRRVAAGEAVPARALTLPAEVAQRVTVQRDVITQAQARRTQATTALNATLTELRTPGLSDERRRTLEEQLGTQTTAVQEAEQAEQAVHTSLRADAEQANTTTTALLAGRTSERGLTPLTAPEQERRTLAMHQLESADRQLLNQRSNILGIEQNLQNLRVPGVEETGPEADNLRRQRTALQQQLRQARTAMGTATVARQEALRGVSADARGRAVTPEEYLNRTRERGFVSPRAVEEIRRQADLVRAGEARTGQLATQLNVTPGQLRGGASISERLERARAEYNTRNAQTPQNLARDIFKAFGFAVPTTGEAPAYVGELAAMATGTAGQNNARILLQSQNTLMARAVAGVRQAGGAEPTDQATRSAAIDSMATEYFHLRNNRDSTGRLLPEAERTNAMTAFQRRYGFQVDSRGMLTGAGNEQWAQFQRAMIFQQQRGFLGVGPGGGAHRPAGAPESLLTLFRGVMEAQPQQRPEDGRRPADGAGGSMNIHGSLRIEGLGTGNFVDTTGRNFDPSSGGP